MVRRRTDTVHEFTSSPSQPAQQTDEPAPKPRSAGISENNYELENDPFDVPAFLRKR